MLVMVVQHEQFVGPQVAVETVFIHNAHFDSLEPIPYDTDGRALVLLQLM